MMFLPDPLSYSYLGDTQERQNPEHLGRNPWNRNSFQVFYSPHLSLETVSSILESRRNVCVQGSGDGNDNSCHMDCHNGNTNNHLECKVLVLFILILEKDSFDFIL